VDIYAAHLVMLDTSLSDWQTNNLISTSYILIGDVRKQLQHVCSHTKFLLTGIFQPSNTGLNKQLGRKQVAEMQNNVRHVESHFKCC